jgi:hypothetical protein
MISFQALDRSRTWIGARPSLVQTGASIVLLTVLLTPSVWMLTMIPPLWRDVDAYVQVTQPPGPGTILQYGPLYCFVARIPLYVGYAIQSLVAGAPLPGGSFFVRPVLTDADVFVLVLSQHLSLCVASFYFIVTTTRLFWIRVALAVAWAFNPLLYTFAHCIGSETLSMILVLIMCASGLRIIRFPAKVPRKEWVVFGVLLSLCILTRHINAALAALMPAALIFLGTYDLIVFPFTQSPSLRDPPWLKAKYTLEKAAVAIVVGIGCIVLANTSQRVLCYATRIPYYSSVGQAFMVRLKFLAALPPEKRNQVLDDATKHAASADVKQMISLIRAAFPTKTPNWDVQAFSETAKALLFTQQADAHGEKFYVLLNHTMLAFLYPPNKIFLSAVASDFKTSQQITIPDVVSFLFVTTRFYFSHAASMPQCASLVTFRDKSAAQVFDIFKKHSYFRHLKNVSYHAFLLFCFIALAAFIAIAKIRQHEAAGLASYTIALTVVGLFMMLANSVLVVFQPRYTLPMWELTIVSASILSAKTIELFAGHAKSSSILHQLRSSNFGALGALGLAKTGFGISPPFSPVFPLKGKK